LKHHNRNELVNAAQLKAIKKLNAVFSSNRKLGIPVSIQLNFLEKYGTIACKYTPTASVHEKYMILSIREFMYAMTYCSGRNIDYIRKTNLNPMYGHTVASILKYNNPKYNIVHNSNQSVGNTLFLTLNSYKNQYSKTLDALAKTDSLHTSLPKASQEDVPVQNSFAHHCTELHKLVVEQSNKVKALQEQLNAEKLNLASMVTALEVIVQNTKK
jgi:hypothetical protein